MEDPPVNELKLPELGENIDSAEVSAVLVAEGDIIGEDQPVIEVETEKASLEVPSTFAGRVQELRVRRGDKIKVGQVILTVADSRSAERAPEPAPKPVEPVASVEPVEPEPPARPVLAFPAKSERPARPEIGETAPAAPSVRALARELGIDVHGVAGSGPAGRITRDDVKAHAKRLLQSRPAEATAELPDFAEWGEIEREPMSSLRRKTADNMARAWASIPSVTQFDRADITELEAMRKKFNTRYADSGRKLTLTAIGVKIAAAALRQFPKFNASLDVAGAAVILKKYVHIGVAVDTERGLLVPVIRDADRAGLLQIASRLNELAEQARAKKLKPEELRGGTFTISNLGALGTTYFSPIVNWPEVALLGVGRAETMAVHQGTRFRPRLILPLSLSYDHRLIDGAEAARFLRWIADALEQPLLLLLEEPAP
jgi:pyruvate dehydrogenase E2 component (dihydrolipoamide acetyltransferase)